MRLISCYLAAWISVGGGLSPVLQAQNASSSPRPAAQAAPAADTAAVAGRALSAGDDPLPGRTVRLRNLQTNTVIGSATTTTLGAFEFRAPRPGSYVIELLDDGGGVLATSMLVNIAAVAGTADAATIVADVRLSRDKPPAGVIASHKIPRALLIALAAAGSGLVAAAVVGQDSTPVR